jgi:hypothetical protein
MFAKFQNRSEVITGSDFNAVISMMPEHLWPPSGVPLGVLENIHAEFGTRSKLELTEFLAFFLKVGEIQQAKDIVDEFDASDGKKSVMLAVVAAMSFFAALTAFALASLWQNSVLIAAGVVALVFAIYLVAYASGCDPSNLVPEYDWPRRLLTFLLFVAICVFFLAESQANEQFGFVGAIACVALLGLNAFIRARFNPALALQRTKGRDTYDNDVEIAAVEEEPAPARREDKRHQHMPPPLPGSPERSEKGSKEKMVQRDEEDPLPVPRGSKDKPRGSKYSPARRASASAYGVDTVGRTQELRTGALDRETTARASKKGLRDDPLSRGVQRGSKAMEARRSSSRDMELLSPSRDINRGSKGTPGPAGALEQMSRNRSLS